MKWTSISKLNRYYNVDYYFNIIFNCNTLSNSHNYVKYDTVDHINNYNTKASV